MHQQLEEKIKKMEMELLSMKTFVSEAENALKKKDEEIAMSESALKKQAVGMDILKTIIAELEKVW